MFAPPASGMFLTPIRASTQRQCEGVSFRQPSGLSVQSVCSRTIAGTGLSKPVPAGIVLLLLWRGQLLLRVCLGLGAEQGSGIMRVERIELHRLLTGVGQGDVDATVLRQVDGVQVAQDLLSLFIRQLRILLDEILYLVLRERLRIAESNRVDRRLRNTLSDQEVLDASDAAFGECLVVLGPSAWIRVTGEGQARIRLNLQVILEVRCQGGENLLLTFCQALIRTLLIRQSGWEEDAVQQEARRRWRWWRRRSSDIHAGIRRCRVALVIRDAASDLHLSTWSTRRSVGGGGTGPADGAGGSLIGVG